MKIIHRVKSLLGKKRKYLKLWSQGFELRIATSNKLLIVNPILSTTEQLNEETGRNEIKPHKECTDDVCQLRVPNKRHMEQHKMTPFYCIECTQPSALRSPTTFENALSISIDGDQLEPDRSNFIQKPGSIFTLIKVPLQKSDISTRVRRDRPNRQRACSHRIVCQAGDHILEKMKILPVYIRMPVVGIKRHDKYKELRLRPSGKYYKVSKSSNTDLYFACLSDSIPISSVGWIREVAGSHEIISNTSYLEMPKAQVHQSGKYYCYGANHIGMKIVELRLRIH